MAGRLLAVVILAGIWLSGAGSVVAATDEELDEATAVDTNAVEVTAAVETNVVPIFAGADRLVLDRRSGWAEAEGHVIVTHGDDVLRAEHARLNVQTREAWAWGGVNLKLEDSVWSGDALQCDFDARSGSFSNFWCNDPPFFVKASSALLETNGTARFRGARATTCTNDMSHWHYHMKVRDIAIFPDNGFEAHHVIWYLGRVPVFYLPYLEKTSAEDSGFLFSAGQDSRLGVYLLSSYGYPLVPHLTGRTHVDYRSKRGFGYGQDALWTMREESGAGDLSGYYAEDRAPDTGRQDDPELVGTIPAERYRLRLRHDQDFTFRDSLLVSAEYLSDPELRQDFFDHEYRASRDPDNHMAFNHRGERYTADILVRSRLNDFYTSVNRLPELSTEVFREQIGATPFEYEAEASLAYLEKEWQATESNRQDYAAFRADSLNMVYYPSRLFGFLNVIPRAGYRGTYYSVTREQVPSVTTNFVEDQTLVVGAAPIAVVRTNLVDVPAPAELRSLYELGVELSFKAFRTWDDEEHPLRHIVEPHANYTFVPPLNLNQERIYQFDGIDKLEEQHTIRFGARNKIQTKRKKRVSDIVDVDVYTIYNIKRDEGQAPFENIYMDLQMDPVDWMRLEMDAKYGIEESTLDEINTRVILSWEDWLEADVEHRLKPGESSLLKGDLTLLPDRPWSFDIQSRYELEDDRLEEQAVHVQRTFDCIAFRLGGGIIPGYADAGGSNSADEWRATVEVWLTAFPKSGFRVATERL